MRVGGEQAAAEAAGGGRGGVGEQQVGPRELDERPGAVAAADVAVLARDTAAGRGQVEVAAAAAGEGKDAGEVAGAVGAGG